MAEKEYIIPFREDARKRHYHKTERGRVVKFMVQLEIRHESKWREVVRYDCTNGFAHRDAYNLSGKHVKEELYLSFEETLTLADDDIDDNWETYKHRFLEGELL